MADPARCQVVLVTLPETTPVNEALETATSLTERVGVRLGPVVVNGVDDGPPLPAEAADTNSPMRRAAEFRNARRQLHRDECARLAAQLALPQLHVPQAGGALVESATVDTLAATLTLRAVGEVTS